MPLRTAIAQFLCEFDLLQTQYVSMALHALTEDGELIAQAQTRLELKARLTLLKRVAMGRAIGSRALMELGLIIDGTVRLHAKHEELSRNLLEAAEGTLNNKNSASNASLPVSQRHWVPTEDEINECNVEARKLQRSLQSFAYFFRRGRTNAFVEW